MDIKKLRPTKKTRFRQGVIHPDSCKKLFESQKNKPVIYRSSYEYKFINWLEHCDKIKNWASESLAIPYALDNGEHHTYYPDYVVRLENGTTWIVEIKPKTQTTKPKTQNNYLWTQWLKNTAKWRAAIEFCKNKGYEFKIFTEDTICRLV